jgi:hypothetical protein
MLGAILPLHDVRYHAPVFASRRMSPEGQHDGCGIVFDGRAKMFDPMIEQGSRAPRENGGARRDRTDDLLLAKQALSQLSYGPGERTSHAQHDTERESMVGLGRLELPTSRLSSARSNQLSYKPLILTNGRILRRGTHVAAAPESGTGSSVKKEKQRRRCPAKRALTEP